MIVYHIIIMNDIIKKILSNIGLIIALILTPFRIMIVGVWYLSRSIYSQWNRLQLQKSGMDIIFSYPCELRGGKYISCGNGVFLGPNGILSAWDFFQGIRYTPQIIIGNNVTIGTGFHISAISKIVIDDNVLTGKYITIVDNGHGYASIDDMKTPPIKRKLRSYDSVFIGKNVWIGDKVTIVGNVVIGEGAIIGSNSVVTKNVPPYSVVAGVPAKIIKSL